MFHKLYLLFTEIVLAQVPSSGVSSGGVWPPSKFGSQTIGELLNRIAGYLIEISIPIVAIMVIIGGFQMLFSSGDPEKFKKGKNTILYAAAGFAIVLLAKGITSIIENILRV
ncbi:MAG: pilin [bacterium]|nr:pilin [bacterium]